MVEYRSKLDRIRTNFRRFKSKVRHEIFIPENFMLILTPVLLIAWFVGTIASLNRNWQLQQEIATKRLDQQRLELEIESLSLENQYYASDEYQELAARHLQNKKLPGEKLVYLPENSESAKTKYSSDPSETPTAPTPSNLQQWLTYLFGA